MSRTARTTCDMLVERLSAVIDGDLPKADCERITRHVRHCARCRSLTADLRATIGTCQRAAERPLPAAVRARARDSIKQLLARPKDN